LQFYFTFIALIARVAAKISSPVKITNKNSSILGLQHPSVPNKLTRRWRSKCYTAM